MTNETLQPHALTSVMFMPGNYRALFSKTDLNRQLDGVRELLDIADSYVLNDKLVAGALRLHNDDNEITSFLLEEAVRSDVIDVITDNDLDAFRQTIGFFECDSRLSALDKSFNDRLNQTEDPVERSNVNVEFRDARDPLFEEINVLEAQAYILFADKRGAAYVPERLFGFKALERYPELLSKSPHQLTEEFLKTLKQKLSTIHQRDEEIKTVIPSFLLEALRASQNAAGLCSALRDLRHSAAARRYRETARTMTDSQSSEADRLEAYEELDAQSKSAFSKEGVESRIPRMFKLTVALSSFAVAFLFPPAAAAPLVVEAADEVDRWLRRRQNIFQRYPTGSYEDLYVELRRIFPVVTFEPKQLAHFLQKGNFGWAD